MAENHNKEYRRSPINRAVNGAAALAGGAGMVYAINLLADNSVMPSDLTLTDFLTTGAEFAAGYTIASFAARGLTSEPGRFVIKYLVGAPYKGLRYMVTFPWRR